jgi:hypothetical protein
VGEHGQGGMAVPGPVLADLVVVRAGLALGLGEAVLPYRRDPVTQATLFLGAMSVP